MADDLILAAKDLYKNFADTIGVCLGAGGSLLTQRTNFLPKLLPSSFTLPERLKGHRPSSQTLPTSQCPLCSETWASKRCTACGRTIHAKFKDQLHRYQTHVLRSTHKLMKLPQVCGCQVSWCFNWLLIMKPNILRFSVAGLQTSERSLFADLLTVSSQRLPAQGCPVLDTSSWRNLVGSFHQT